MIIFLGRYTFSNKFIHNIIYHFFNYFRMIVI